jgi:hypothetical protein
MRAHRPILILVRQNLQNTISKYYFIQYRSATKNECTFVLLLHTFISLEITERRIAAATQLVIAIESRATLSIH